MAERNLTRGRALGLAVLAALAMAAAGYAVSRSGVVFAAGPTGPVASDLAKGAQLYAENCASCHGVDLEGQPDWRAPGPDGIYPAPPHDETGHTWHHSDQLLFDYTKMGGAALMAKKGIEYNSGMPGFGDQLSDEEIRSVLAFIKSTWPERLRAVQAERSRAESEAE